MGSRFGVAVLLPAVFFVLSSSALQAETTSNKASKTSQKKVDLSGDQFQSINQASSPNSEASGDNMRQWFDRIDLSGFVNAGWVKTGADGAELNGHFYAGERLFGANLFIDAKIADDILAHNELYFYNQEVDLKELYVEFKDFLKTDGLFSLKVGRIDIPYGDEYLWQNAIDNPMVLRTAEWPWGFSQGIEVFGRSGSVGWIASVMDGFAWGVGEDGHPFDHDDSPFKAFNGKLNLDPTDWFHLSASAMENGTHSSSALILDGVNITPVGTIIDAGGPATVTSTLGISPSSAVDFQAYQFDARLKLGNLVQLQGDYGTVNIIDVAPFGRSLRYYYGEAKVNITSQFYVVGRYSAIGTFDSTKGYMFGGDYDGATSFGFDVKSFSRLGGALGYKITDNTILKVEVDNDTVQLIDAAVAAGIVPGNDRYTLASEVDVKF